jgi:hypothetical protein
MTYNEFSSKAKDETYKLFKLNLKSYEGDDFTFNSFINEEVDEKTKESSVRIDGTLVQVIVAIKKPEILKSLKEAITNKNIEGKNEILSGLKEYSIKLGAEADKNPQEFAKKYSQILEGKQFLVIWRPGGITSMNQKTKAGIAPVQLKVYPCEQLEVIKNLKLEDFVAKYREGSIDERNEEAVALLDEVGKSPMDFEETTTKKEKEDEIPQNEAPPKKKGSKESIW